MSHFLQQNQTVCKFSTSDSWVILSPIEQCIKEKIERIGPPLKDWDIQINYGIKTGFNEAFIIDEATKNRLIEEDPKSADIIRPILRGRDIKRYSYEFANLYLIATFPSMKYDIEEYPAIKKHLLSFGKERLEQTGKKYIINGEQISARKKTNNKWFETQDSINYWDDFYKQKIVYSEIVREPQFYLDQKGEFSPEATAFIMTGEYLEYLYVLLHSRLITFSFKTFYAGGGLGESGYRYKKAFLEKLPIIKPTKKILEKIHFLNTHKENDHYEYENFIYELYGLVKEEIVFIESKSI